MPRDRLCSLLMGLLNAEPNGSINYILAHFLLTHLNTMQEMNIQDLSARCQVSRASVSRFCRQLGYRDFYELREDFHRQGDYDMGAVVPSSHLSDREFLEAVQQKTARLLLEVPQTNLDRLAQYLSEYDNVVAMGHMHSGDVALMVQHNLFMAGKLVQVILRPREQLDFFEDNESPVLLLIISVSGTFFHRLYGRAYVPNLPKGSRLCLLSVDCPEKPFPQISLHLNCGTGRDFSGSDLSLMILSKVIALHYRRLTAPDAR